MNVNGIKKDYQMGIIHEGNHKVWKVDTSD